MKPATLRKYHGPVTPPAAFQASPPAVVSHDRFRGYPGSKAGSGVRQRIIGQMRPHSVYVEAFLGSGEVFRHKRPAANSILIDRNPAAVARVGVAAGVRAIVGDSLKLLPEFFAWLPTDSVVYCDPPYLLSTRQGRLYYGPNEMSDEDHATLLAALLQARCDVLISGYPSALYSSRLRHGGCSSPG